MAQAAVTRIPTPEFTRGRVAGATGPHRASPGLTGADLRLIDSFHGGSEADPEELEEPPSGHAHIWPRPRRATPTDRLKVMPETAAFEGLVAMAKNSSSQTDHAWKSLMAVLIN